MDKVLTIQSMHTIWMFPVGQSDKGSMLGWISVTALLLFYFLTRISASLMRISAFCWLKSLSLIRVMILLCLVRGARCVLWYWCVGWDWDLQFTNKLVFFFPGKFAEWKQWALSVNLLVKLCAKIYIGQAELKNPARFQFYIFTHMHILINANH